MYAFQSTAHHDESGSDFCGFVENYDRLYWVDSIELY